MEKVKVDKRTLKTKKAIREAFSLLLSTKDVNEITIKDIADTAQINRKTFYYYYKTPYDVLLEIEDELAQSLDEIFGDIEFTQDNKMLNRIFNKITEVINFNIDFYYKVMKLNGNTDFISKLFNAVKKRIKESLYKRFPITELTASFIANFTVSGITTTYIAWRDVNSVMTLNELSSDLNTIMFDGINGLVNQKKIN